MTTLTLAFADLWDRTWSAETLAKGAIVLALASLVARFLPHMSAARRSLILQSAWIAVLLIPVLATVLPVKPVFSQRAAPVGPTPANAALASGSPSMAPTPGHASSALPAPSNTSIDTRTSTPAAGQSLPALKFDWRQWTWIWPAGSLLLFVRLAVAHVGMRRRIAEGKSPTTAVLAEVVDACKTLQLRAQVDVRLDNRRSIPLVTGVFRPVILLPEAALCWPPQQLRSVLLHELAHVRRHDSLLLAISQFALALHWPNPLAWLANRQTQRERELACDDLVLSSGMLPSIYADSLLAVVAEFVPAKGVLGLAMARPSSLESRLTAVLNSTQDRRAVSRRFGFATLFATCALVLPLAMLSAADPPPKDTLESKLRSSNPAPTVAGKRIENEELVFFSRYTKRPFGVFNARDGSTWEIDERVFHGADIITTLRIRWPALAGQPAQGYDEQVAMDAFGNRENWAIAWFRGERTIWTVSIGWDGYPKLRRIEWSTGQNPNKITANYQTVYPGEPIRGLDLPPKLVALLEEFAGLKQPKLRDRSGGLPDIGGEIVSKARPLDMSGKLLDSSKPTKPAPLQDWPVYFVDGVTGKPVGVRSMLAVQTHDGSRSYWVQRFLFGNDQLHIKLAQDEFATLFCEDERYVGGGPNCLVGNLPEGRTSVGPKAQPGMPTEMKVWPGEAIVGQVVDVDGAPAVGVQVRVGAYVNSADWKARLGMENRIASWDHGEWPNWIRVVKTDGKGEFSACAPPAEARTFLQINCDTPNSASFETRLGARLEQDAGPASDQGKLVIRLRRGVRLHGRVLDSQQRPLTNVEVILSGPRGKFAGPRARTDADGNYTLQCDAGGVLVTIDTRPRNQRGEVIGESPRAKFDAVPIQISADVTEVRQDFVGELLPAEKDSTTGSDKTTIPPRPLAKPGGMPTISIAANGALTVNGSATTLAELGAKSESMKGMRVGIEADEAVPFAKILPVFKMLQAAGVKEFQFQGKKALAEDKKK